MSSMLKLHSLLSLLHWSLPMSPVLADTAWAELGQYGPGTVHNTLHGRGVFMAAEAWSSNLTMQHCEEAGIYHPRSLGDKPYPQDSYPL